MKFFIEDVTSLDPACFRLMQDCLHNVGRTETMDNLSAVIRLKVQTNARFSSICQGSFLIYPYGQIDACKNSEGTLIILPCSPVSSHAIEMRDKTLESLHAPSFTLLDDQVNFLKQAINNLMLKNVKEPE